MIPRYRVWDKKAEETFTNSTEVYRHKPKGMLDGSCDYTFDWKPFGYLSDEEMENHLTDIFENGRNFKRAGI
ncbi:hypothetical protein MKJ39_001001 [Enterococcus faecium]|nr:hypothetical protein [Enterococcus faecium]